MKNSSLDIESIDKICCDFEDFWAPEQTLQHLKTFAANHVPENSTDFPTLFSELAQIDVEHRWREASKAINQRTIENVAEYALQISSIPRLKDYLALFGDSPGTEEIRRALGDTELKSRCKFGDAPSPTRYGIPAELWEKYEKLTPTISIWHGGVCSFEAPLCGPLMIGRQGLEEPEHPAMLHDAQNMKLICCPLSEKTISRQQLCVELVAGKWIKLTNTSTNRHFHVINQAALAPSASQFYKVPCTIDLDILKIRINRPLFEQTP